MLPPTWLVDGLAGIMLVTASYCAARLVAARLWGRTLHQDVNVAHMADGVAMAGMLVASLRTLPDGAWEIVFGAMTLWFGSRGARLLFRQGPVNGDGANAYQVTHNLSHLVMSGAMLYMFVETSSPTTGSAAASPGAMSVMGGTAAGGSSLALVALLFLLVLFASAVWHADGLTRFTTTRRVVVGLGQRVPVGLGVAGPAATHLGAVDSEISPESDTTEAAQVGQALWLAPRLETACHIVVCITMGYMLVLLL